MLWTNWEKSTRSRADGAKIWISSLGYSVSQIIGAQAVLNVLFGVTVRVSNQLRDLVYGLYGKTPMPIDAELTKKILKNYRRDRNLFRKTGRLS